MDEAILPKEEFKRDDKITLSVTADDRRWDTGTRRQNDLKAPLQPAV